MVLANMTANKVVVLELFFIGAWEMLWHIKAIN